MKASVLERGGPGDTRQVVRYVVDPEHPRGMRRTPAPATEHGHGKHDCPCSRGEDPCPNCARNQTAQGPGYTSPGSSQGIYPHDEPAPEMELGEGGSAISQLTLPPGALPLDEIVDGDD